MRKRSTLLTRFAGESDWRRAPMVPGADSRSFEMFLFDLVESGEYRVAAEGLRSPAYRIEVAELPKVERIDLTYHFPERLGLAPKTVKDAGDIQCGARQPRGSDHRTRAQDVGGREPRARRSGRARDDRRSGTGVSPRR